MISAITINQPVAPLTGNANAASNVSCYAGANGTITNNVNGGTTPYSYTWSNGASTQNLSGLVAGSYSVTITDSKGCTATSSATISQPATALSSSISSTTNISCRNGANGAVNTSTSGGTAPYT